MANSMKIYDRRVKPFKQLVKFKIIKMLFLKRNNIIYIINRNNQNIKRIILLMMKHKAWITQIMRQMKIKR